MRVCVRVCVCVCVCVRHPYAYMQVLCASASYLGGVRGTEILI